MDAEQPYTVLIADVDGARVHAVRKLLRPLHVRVERVRGPEVRDAADATPACFIAVVALESETAGHPSLESAIGVLRRRGYAVLCYGRGAGGWRVDTTARVLLQGAAAVLDCESTTFGAHLLDWVGSLLGQEGEKRREDARSRALLNAQGVIGACPAILEVFRWTSRVSPLSDLPVLLLGETGTGKELIARAIHRLDPKRGACSFVAVNCAAINGSLAESEFFGHRRGAFTGADRERKGLFRAADGGVLFLDEVGDLDGVMQGKLLRVLQEGRVLAVGEDRDAAVDVRIIAATNRDLRALVDAGSFRADLYHRLNVLTMELPPLRDRTADLGLLVAHFVAKHDAMGIRTPPEPTSGFVAALAGLHLEGNVRELENVVRRVLVSKRDETPLSIHHLPPDLLQRLLGEGPPAAPVPATAGAPALAEARTPAADARDAYPVALFDAEAILTASDWSLSRALEFCERRLMETALAAARGNHAEAARRLGITPRTIYNKVRKLRLPH
jgi:transcriptional regulator with GAF, ATPase, and Fis domain